MLGLILLAVSACGVTVVDATPAAGPPAAAVAASPQPAAAVEHDLAIMAVDFDPPLDYENRIRLRRSLTLLVAVENQGRATERSVAVQAWLSSPEDAELLLSGQATIDSIAPGEVQIVRFPAMEKVPTHLAYRLEVQVGPLSAETDVQDNRKAFDIKIRPETGNP